MDEIEYRKMYNEACNELNNNNPIRASLIILQLINHLNERIDDLHVEDDDDGC